MKVCGRAYFSRLGIEFGHDFYDTGTSGYAGEEILFVCA
jgi:hypothetical protein